MAAAVQSRWRESTTVRELNHHCQLCVSIETVLFQTKGPIYLFDWQITWLGWQFADIRLCLNGKDWQLIGGKDKHIATDLAQ